jgi:hypothetical protein
MVIINQNRIKAGEKYYGAEMYCPIKPQDLVQKIFNKENY